MTRMLGLLCAVLAFVGQLSFATIVQADEAQASQIAALQAASIDCHPSSTSGHHTPHQHHKADPALSPVRLSLPLPALTSAPPIAARVPRVIEPAIAGMPPPACGPPPATARVGRPRAPPALT